jgi:hypothetical protein
VIRLQRKAGTFLPTFAQHHLLRAALLEDPELVHQSFTAWKSRVELDTIEHGSMRLLPLLYRNLQRAAIDDPLLPRLKGIYRQVWFRNQLLFAQGARALRLLADAGIATIVLKGAALVGSAYDEAALRPMEDFDVLVPRQQFARAVEVLRAGGWAFQPPLLDPEPHFLFQHAIGLRREGGGELDLHWSSIGLPSHDTAAGAVLGSALPWRVGNQETRTLAPADLLLQICGHATRIHEEIPPIRWAADAFLLLASAPFPWDTVAPLARVRGLSLVMHRALEYLRDGLGVAVPEKVLAALRRQIRLRDQLTLNLRNGAGRLAYLQFALETVQRVFTDVAGAPRRLLLLPRYLRSYCRVPTNRALVRLVTSRLALNTRRARG